ncbi:TauD/TfdA dioxygenase family protein [Caballeronia mineralivorans]|nr:TauD/TfdA family dioxygenase [Caballeronia mineralivorans]
MALKVRRSNPSLRAELSSVNLRKNVFVDVAREIYPAWLDANDLPIVRGQKLEPKERLAFAGIFGQVLVSGGVQNDAKCTFIEMRKSDALPEFPQVERMSNNIDAEGRPIGRQEAGMFWHKVLATSPTRGKASILHAIEVPPCGGDTVLASVYRAYDTLSERMKVWLEGLEVMHTLAKIYGQQMTAAGDAKANTGAHDVVRFHHDTGCKSIFDRGFPTEIVCMTAAESAAIPNFLFAHCEQPQFIYRDQWQESDLLIWDNRCTIHHAVSDYNGVGWRYAHRCTVKRNKVRNETGAA